MPDNALVSPAPQPELQQNALQSPAMAQQQAAPPPQISHQQAVAALRHFSAIARELEGFMDNENLGKSSIKSEIIDGTTKLVSSQMLTPSQAVQVLGSVPDEPQLQRQWVKQHFIQTMLSMNAVLDHHAASNPGTMNVQTEIARSRHNPKDHMQHMSGLMTSYKGSRRA